MKEAEIQVEYVPAPPGDEAGPPRVRLTNPATGERSEYLLTFKPEEWANFKAYVDYASDLAATKFVAEGHGTKLHFSYEAGKPPAWEVEAPPDEIVDALVHRLRPLILKDERTSFGRVRNSLARMFQGTELQPFLQWVLTLYDGRYMQQLIKLESNRELINSEEMLMIWLNGYEYHRDPQKREHIEAHTKIAPFDWSRAVFLTLLVEKIKAIMQLNALVELILKKRDSLSVDM